MITFMPFIISDRMKKGITPIVSIIVLLLITVALAGVAWVYLSDFLGDYSRFNPDRPVYIRDWDSVRHCYDWEYYHTFEMREVPYLLSTFKDCDGFKEPTQTGCCILGLTNKNTAEYQDWIFSRKKIEKENAVGIKLECCVNMGDRWIR